MQLTKTGAIVSRASVGDRLMTMFLECLSRGMTLPFTVRYVGVNGAVSVSRLPDLDSPMEMLFANAERLELPVNVMVVDRLGRSFISAFDPDNLH
jgi:hypothetical protein